MGKLNDSAAMANSIAMYEKALDHPKSWSGLDALEMLIRYHVTHAKDLAKVKKHLEIMEKTYPDASETETQRKFIAR